MAQEFEIMPERAPEKELNKPLEEELEKEQDKIIDPMEKDIDKDMSKEELVHEKKHAPIRKEKTTDELINNAKIKCELDKLEKEITELKENLEIDEEAPDSEAVVKSPENELVIEKEPGQDMSYMLNGQRLEKEQMIEKLLEKDDKEALFKSLKETRKKIAEMNRAYMKEKTRRIIKALGNKKSRGTGKVPDDKVNAVDERQDSKEQEYQNIDNDIDYSR